MTILQCSMFRTSLPRCGTKYQSSVQLSSVAQSCPTLCDPTLCDPKNRSTPGLPVHHQLPEFTQTNVHWVSDATQPSHLLSSPSPPAPDQIANIRWIIEKARVPEKHLFLLYWLCQILWLCGSPQTVENSERDGNTRPPDLSLEKPVCRSGSNS